MEKELMNNVVVFINAADMMMKGNVADLPKNLANMGALIESAKLAMEKQGQVEGLPWATEGSTEEAPMQVVTMQPKKRKRRTKAEIEADRILEEQLLKAEQVAKEAKKHLKNEFLAASTALANDPDLKEEIEAWEVTLNDGLDELEKEEKEEDGSLNDGKDVPNPIIEDLSVELKKEEEEEEEEEEKKKRV